MSNKITIKEGDTLNKTGDLLTKDLQLFDIALEKILGAYNRRETLHTLFQQNCRKQGLTYTGRSWFTKFDTSKSVVTINFGGEFETILPANLLRGMLSSHSINPQFGVDEWTGVRNYYTKLTPKVTKVIQDTLIEYYDKLLKQTNRQLLDKFKTIDSSGNIFKKVITVDNELIYDLKSQREWVKEAQKIMNKAKKDFEKQKREIQKLKKYISNKNNYLLSIDKLVEIGKAILGRSTELCPIETGFLRSSGTIYVYEDHIRIIYECPYATYVHENLENYHPFGQAKFLETAAQEILQNRDVWVESGQNVVYGNYWNFEWLKEKGYNDLSDAYLVKHDSYGTVYIDIDRNLRVNYHHYMGED